MMQTNINVEMMPFKKFVESKRVLFQEEKRELLGCFKEKGSKRIFTGDNFSAHVLCKGDAEKTYQLYIDWFNHTRTPNEKERIMVSAMWNTKENTQGGL